MGFITRGWKGEEKLWKITWLGYIGGALVVTVVAYGLFVLIQDSTKYFLGPAVIVLNVWGLVAMWRCAHNVSWKGWFYLARILVVLTVIAWVLEYAGMLE